MLNYFFEISPPAVLMSAFILPLVSVLALGPWMIRKLRTMKAEQPVRRAHGNCCAPDHDAKAGTPTMGGILIIGTLLLYALLCLPLESVYLQCILLVTTVTAFLGLLDDYAKIKKHNSDGVNGWFKIALQLTAAVICALYLYTAEPSVERVMVPFYGWVHLGRWFIPLAILTIIATSNAVNLTDGQDGLASGCMIPAAIFFFMVAVMNEGIFAEANFISLAGVSVVISAACLGFLWYNCYPAKVFMGDTGSLALGGALGTLAVCTGMELMLIILSGVFVAEASSVVIQVMWFKLTQRLYGAGRRFFRMAPIHHHFEKCGMRETQVCVRFWIVSFILFIVAVLALIQ